MFFSYNLRSGLYSGNAHGIIRGIGMVNCIYINPTTEQFWVIDFRIFDPERDGKTKMDHFRDMLNAVHYHKQLPYKTGETVYQIKHGLLRNYLIEPLKNPTVSVGFA